MIEINIKNSTITSATKSASTRMIEISPTIIVARRSLIKSSAPGPANIMMSESTRQAKPEAISIIAVKNFELMSSFFVTGKVWVR